MAALQAAYEATRDPQVGVNLGAALVLVKRFGQAELVLREVLAKDPSSAAAWYNLGLALRGLGRQAEADRALRQAAALGSRRPGPFSGGRMRWLRENWLDFLIFVLIAVVAVGVVLYLVGLNPFAARPAPPPAPQAPAATAPGPAGEAPAEEPVVTVLPLPEAPPAPSPGRPRARARLGAFAFGARPV